MRPGEIVAAVKDIPEGEAVDKFVDTRSSQQVVFTESGNSAVGGEAMNCRV